jgi:hypothetical protein
LAVHVPGEADLNLYAYVSGQALRIIDPLGLEGQYGESGQSSMGDQTPMEEVGGGGGDVSLPDLPDYDHSDVGGERPGVASGSEGGPSAEPAPYTPWQPQRSSNPQQFSGGSEPSQSATGQVVDPVYEESVADRATGTIIVIIGAAVIDKYTPGPGPKLKGRRPPPRATPKAAPKKTPKALPPGPPPPKQLPARAGPTGQITTGEVRGKTPAQIDARAKELGLKPMGPDPARGRGSYVDPQTNRQRILSHPDDKKSGPHGHVNDIDERRIGPGGRNVRANSPEAHIPIKKE